jgi:hydroxymethylpyrimidine pyrophosphatase-like HAD family hydrolase
VAGPLLRVAPVIRLQALALDYDGTLASHDHLSNPIVAALERARRAGLQLILVTGRTFFELTRVCHRLDLFDVIVAENGAVLHYPADDAIRDEGPAPPARLIAALDRHAIPFQVGRVIVATGHSYEAQVRRLIAEVGVDLELVRNRAALMLLPRGVSKGSGVRHALQRLGISFHDVLAIGDAENDLEMFATCGFSACPGNAVAEVAQVADWVFAGESGEAIARAIEGPILNGALSAPRSGRERITLGWARATTAPVTISAHGVNVLVHGDTLSGKSWLAGGLVERLVAARYATCVIDPEGDYQALADVRGITWCEIRAAADWDAAVATFERNPAGSVVADLSALPADRQLDHVRHGLTVLRRLRALRGLPHWIVLDEAHYSLHPAGVPDDAAGLDAKGFCLVTYRPSGLRASVLEAIDLFVFGRTTAADELAFLRTLLERRGWCGASVFDSLPELTPPDYLLAARDGSIGFVPPPRATRHVRHLGKYADHPVAPAEAFLFRRRNGRLAAEAHTLRSFLAGLREVDDDVLVHHASRGDFSRWVDDVFLDRQLASQLRKIERRSGSEDVVRLRATLTGLVSGLIEP